MMSQREMELDQELSDIHDMVEKVLGSDQGVSDQTFNTVVNKIQADWKRNGHRGQGDVYDFVNSYLKDWVGDARSEGGGPGLGSGSRLSRGENNTIWGDDWESVIDRATQKPEPDDDYYSQDKGGYNKAANWQGRTNPALEENQQEDEDGDEVTHRSTEPKAIEILEPLSDGYVISVEMPNGEIRDVEFHLDGDIEEVDPPYGYAGTIWGDIDGKEYGIAVDLVKAGGGDWDMDISSDGLNLLEGSWNPDDVDPDEYDDMSEMASPSNQQEDEDGDQVYEDENIEATKKDPNYVQEIVKAYAIIKDLERAGVISKQELDKVMEGLGPIYSRLKG